ncbi:MAG: uridine kinase [Chloroflexota bacterium]
MKMIRKDLVRIIADRILALPTSQIICVGIDGVDGAGKSCFACELAVSLARSGRPLICTSVDSFHNPKAQRYQLGKGSPRGFFRDSYNYQRLKEVLLDPLSPGGSQRYQTAIFDHRTDLNVVVPAEHAALDSILVFDGIFLHRPELRSYWDFSIFLDVGFRVSIPRGAQRGEGSADPEAAENYRYVEGQRIYLRECEPKKHATIVVNNDDLLAPFIVTQQLSI